MGPMGPRGLGPIKQRKKDKERKTDKDKMRGWYSNSERPKCVTRRCAGTLGVKSCSSQGRDFKASERAGWESTWLMFFICASLT